MAPQISVLDQSPVRKGGTSRDAINETLALARHCDRLGFHRYWVAEHHNSPALAGSTPEILIGRIAGLTEGIRVGSGGVMLSHYSPYKVAENFRMLETLYPGRIDLGIGRAPGSDQRTAAALAAGPGKLGLENFPHLLADLESYLRDTLPAGHHFAGLHAEPRGPGLPEMWVLGSSGESAAFAAHFGLPYSFAHFITAQGGVAAMAQYRKNFQASEPHPEPRCSIGVFVICADSDAAAAELALSRDLFLVNLRQGNPQPVASPQEVRGTEFSRPELAVIADARNRTIAGSPTTIKRHLDELLDVYGAEEAVVVTITYDFEARLRSYELLAEVYELEARR